MTPKRPTVEVVRLVRVDYLAGEGVEGNPARIISAYYDLTGQLVFEIDHWQVARDRAIADGAPAPDWGHS